MSKLCLLSLSALFFFCFSATTAQESSSSESNEIVRPTVRASRINPEPPVIDGNLNDKIWKSDHIEFTRILLQMEPDEGKPATESTVVAVAYDDAALYVAIWNYDDDPEGIKKVLTRRDRSSESDKVSVRIDAYHDKQSGYAFEVNAAGVQRDWRMFNDTWTDDSWDGVWQSAVKVHPWGWGVEYRIPYYCLRFTDKEEHTWGFNVTRYISRKQESLWWSFSPSTEGGNVSRYGTLAGITGISPPRHMEMMPYAVSKLNTEPARPGNSDGREYFGDVGLDLKYGVSSNLTLDATINPDFGQVELDSPVLNLTAFETFFPEKRPFFLEGVGIFSSNYDLFYSRRIGRSPRGGFDNVDYYTDRPSSTTILGAAKLTGKINQKTTIGVLTALTDKESAKYVDISGVSRSGVVEPTASYNVFRVKRDVLSGSYVGLLGTLVSQDSERPVSTGGIDWRLATKSAVWRTDGQIVTSNTVAGQNPGFGFNGSIQKEGGKWIRGSVGWDIRDPNLDLNDMGFLSRNDYRDGWGWIQFRVTDDIGILRNQFYNFNYWNAWNYNGDQISLGWNYNGYLEFQNGWWLSSGYSQNLQKYDDFETRGNGLWERPHSWTFWTQIGSDPRKDLVASVYQETGKYRNGDYWYVSFYPKIRPLTNVEINANISFLRTFGTTRWVENADDDVRDATIPIFAESDQDKIEFGLGSTVTLTNNLSWQLSGEMLISALDYSNPREYVGNGNYAPLVNLERDNNYYDFNVTALNSTMLIRWEYMPGSTLYLVWTRAHSGDGSFGSIDLKRDLDAIFSGNSDNVFLIKATYWWNI